MSVRSATCAFTKAGKAERNIASEKTPYRAYAVLRVRLELKRGGFSLPPVDISTVLPRPKAAGVFNGRGATIEASRVRELKAQGMRAL
jgi:hypothetical protein